MSNLHPEQFKNYMPAAQEGKATSDWLSTQSGHDWQDDHAKATKNFDFSTHASGGLFSIKEDKHVEGEHNRGSWSPGWSDYGYIGKRPEAF